MKKNLSLILAISMTIASVGCNAPKQTTYVDQEKLENVADAVYLGNIVTLDDNRDNFIYPGFIDGHNHMGLVATMLIDGAILSATDTLRQNAATMKEYIETHPGKEVYKGLGFWVKDYDEDPPTHEFLDKYEKIEYNNIKEMDKNVENLSKQASIS